VSPEPAVLLFSLIIGFGLPILGIILLARWLRALKGRLRYGLDALIIFILVSGGVLGAVIALVPGLLSGPGLLMWTVIELWIVDGILFVARRSNGSEIGWVQVVKGHVLGCWCLVPESGCFWQAFG
jgi:hypothetical protein